MCRCVPQLHVTWPCSFLNIQCRLGQNLHALSKNINKHQTPPSVHLSSKQHPSKHSLSGNSGKEWKLSGCIIIPCVKKPLLFIYSWLLYVSKEMHGNRVSFQRHPPCKEILKRFSLKEPNENEMHHWSLRCTFFIHQGKTGWPSRHPQVGNVRKHPWRKAMAPDTTATKDRRSLIDRNHYMVHKHWHTTVAEHGRTPVFNVEIKS